MSRTLNGNYTGRAASIERHEVLEQLREARHNFNARWLEACAELKEIDPDFDTWYDAQTVLTCGEMLPLIEERISLIHSSIVQQKA
jgi:hypothetical protein